MTKNEKIIQAIIVLFITVFMLFIFFDILFF